MLEKIGDGVGIVVKKRGDVKLVLGYGLNGEGIN
jgi:hypothetical protein